MKLIYTIILIIVLLIGAGALVFFYCKNDWCLICEWQKNRIIDNFEKCAAAGNPVMESYPRQCQSNGRIFIEAIIPAGNNEVKIENILPNSFISSPLEVRGQALGSWYFEASFPIKLVDESGKIIATAIAQAQSDWMTENFVPFEARLQFNAPQGSVGTLILENDNPSGLPENSKIFSVPVRF